MAEYAQRALDNRAKASERQSIRGVSPPGASFLPAPSSVRSDRPGWWAPLNRAPRVRALAELHRALNQRAHAAPARPFDTRQAGPPVQRLVVRGDGTRQHNIDLVNTVIGFRDFGVTPGRINTEEFPGGNASGAVNGPVLRATPVDNRIAVRAGTEPINIVDYRMELPAPPPWQRNMAKDEVIPYVEMVAGRGYAPNLEALRQSATNDTLFRVEGAPGDAAFAASVETHEERHVADLWTTTAQILEPWDANIRRMRQADAPIVANDEQAARTTFYEAIGGTPERIGERMVNDMRERGLAFHETAAGGPPVVADVAAVTNPNRLTLKWRHPLG